MSQIRCFLRAKIHRAVVTEANVDYVGSISIDEDLMDAAALAEYEQVHVVGLTGGARVITYVLRAPRGSGTIGLNGAAALLIEVGERVIIMAYAQVSESDVQSFHPRLVFVTDDNRVEHVAHREIHGTVCA